MKIKITNGVVVEGQKCAAGDEVEVADRLGRQLIANGKAVKVLVLKPEPKAVKPKVVKKKAVKRNKLTLEE